MELEKDFICTEIFNLDRADKIIILSIIKNFDKTKIQEFPDGSRINLDNLPDTIITTIYNKIKYILKLDS